MNIPWTSIGLASDIFGILMLFRYGPPISALLPDGSELVWDREYDSQSPKAKKARREFLYSKIALGFIILGFILQLIGSIVS